MMRIVARYAYFIRISNDMVTESFVLWGALYYGIYARLGIDEYASVTQE